MATHLIYWPMLAQMGLVMAVLIINGVRKANDVKAGIANREKAAMDNEAWSKPVILTSKNLANQFQFPVVFYALCLMLASLNAVSMLTLMLAWVFVIIRFAHAYIHITSNTVMIRMRLFIVSMLVLLALFITSIITLAQLA